MSTLTDAIAAITSTMPGTAPVEAPAPAVAVTITRNAGIDEQGYDLADAERASEARIDEFADGGPNVQPVTAMRETAIDEIDPYRFPHGGKVRDLGSPIPVASVALAISAPSATCGVAVQVVSPSAGRARKVVLRNVEAVTLFTDKVDGVDLTTPATGGYILPANSVHETYTQGPIYVAGAAAWHVSAWVDHYGDPVNVAP